MLEHVPQNRRFIILLGAALIVFILWNVPQLEFLMYPFRLFVTYVHEAGHGTAALLSGGRFIGFEVFANGGGLARTAGGNAALILPAGYLGAALFGAVLFYLNNRFHRSQLLSVLIGIGLIGFSILFANQALVAFLVGMLFGAALIVLGYRAAESWNALVLNVLAILTGLNAVLDVWYLVGDSDASLGMIRNDAAAFSQAVAPIIPGAVWAFIWAVLAAAMLGIAFWFSVVRRRA
jgi:hypothetical protein